MNVDRCYVIIYPLSKKLTKTKCLIIITVIWIIGVSIGLLNSYTHEILVIEKSSEVLEYLCSFIEDFAFSQYITISLLLQYIFPLLVLILTLSIIKYNNYVFLNAINLEHRQSFQCHFGNRKNVNI
jgi:hypothetical protein